MPCQSIREPVRGAHEGDRAFPLPRPTVEWGEDRGEGRLFSPHPQSLRISRWLFFEFLRLRRHKSSIRHFPFYAYASSRLMQSVPDFQQDAVRILPPLAIPKTQHLDALPVQPFFALQVVLLIPGCPVLKAVQFNGQSRHWAVEVQKIPSGGMLAAKLEPGKPAGTQRAPEMFFRTTLTAPKPAGVVLRIHLSLCKQWTEK
jgi:hypothetical protein